MLYNHEQNTVEPRNNGSQGTSCFFPVVPNSGVANLIMQRITIHAGRQSTSYNNKAGYTATEVACGWAGAVIKKANLSIWAGAVMKIRPKTLKKLTATD